MTTLTRNTADFPPLDPWWLQAPSEGIPKFAEVFVNVSMALQAALREHLPAAYFEDLEHFRDVQTAYSILVYQSSRVFRGKIRTDLTRDVMNPKLMARMVRMARANLTQNLIQVEERLREAGLPELAEQYSRKRLRHIMKSVQRLRRSRRCLGILVRGEGVLLDALVQLSGLGNRPRTEQKRRVALVKKKWTVQLRRLYPARNFEDFAAVLLDAATRALQSSLETSPGTSGGDPASERLPVPLPANS